MLRIKSCLILALCAVAHWSISAEEPEKLGEALKKGEVTINLRYRYENVSDDAVGDKEANASTLRTTLAYKSQPWKGLSVFLEAEDVTVIGNELYNNAGAGSLRNGITDRPVVADPDLTEINQAFLRLELGKTTLAAGRREINLEDHRYVGNVGWRQNHQAFDALTLVDKSLQNVTFTYAYLDRVSRIFGDSQPMTSHVLSAAIKAGGAGIVKLYGLLLDYDLAANAGLSTRTFAAELVGQRKIGGGENKLLYEVELADQADAGDNPNEVDTGYAHVMVGGSFPRVTVKAGWELLDGSPEDGQFSTPLATLHKWNGWADKFLRTPTNGLEDLYLALSGKVGEVGWTAVYHDFGAAEGGASYGEELDLQLTYRTPWKQVFGFKGAFYDAEDFAADTDKVMFWTAYRF